MGRLIALLLVQPRRFRVGSLLACRRAPPSFRWAARAPSGKLVRRASPSRSAIAARCLPSTKSFLSQVGPRKSAAAGLLGTDILANHLALCSYRRTLRLRFGREGV